MQKIIDIFPNISENINLNYGKIKLISDVFLYVKLDAIVSTFPYANFTTKFETTIHTNNRNKLRVQTNKEISKFHKQYLK